MSEKILIVDDIELNRALLENLLNSKYETICASGGREAIDLLERERNDISLVLLDVIMPEVSGYDVLQFMNFHGISKRTPVMLITAADGADAEEKGLAMGAADFIHKPFMPEIVLHRVKNILELYRYQNDLEAVLEEKSETLSNINEIIVAVLTSVLETKTPESKEHVLRIRLYTRELLRYLYEHYDDEYGLTPQAIETMCMASVLHDIGELLISERILNKSNAEMTDEEALIWQQHTVKGCQLIEPMRNIENKEYIRYCYDICRSHHEKWDGSGFPDKLVGDEIPICAQAVALAHQYDRMTVGSGYTHEQAIRRIEEAQYHAFSPVLVETFRLVSDHFRTIHEKNPESSRKTL